MLHRHCADIRIASIVLLAGGLVTLLVLTLDSSLWSDTRRVDLAYITGLLAIVVAIFGLTVSSSADPNRPGSWISRVVGLGSRCLAALALNLLYWVVVIEPHIYHDEKVPFQIMRFVSLVDLPVAVAVLPFKSLRYEVVDVYMQSFPYGSTRFCFGVPPGHLWSHLAVAVPIWLVLLYLPQLSRLLAIRSRSAA